MKTVKLLITISIVFISGSCFSQIRKHTSLFSYGFDKVYMNITNEFAKESDVKTIPTFVSYPYATRRIELYGPTLGFTVTRNNQSSNFLNRAGAGVISYNNVIMDTLFRSMMNKMPAKYAVPYKGKLVDSLTKGHNRFDITKLQVRVMKNNVIIQDWKNITALNTLHYEGKLSASGTFIVFNDPLLVDDRVTIIFRNKTDTSLIRFEFVRINAALTPNLVSYERDSTSLSYGSFIQKILQRSIYTNEATSEFYRYRPASDLLRKVLQKERIFSDTKLALHFAKPDPKYIDTSLQYILAYNDIKDSVWRTTGHILFLSNFKPNKDYTLLVRYKSEHGNVKKFTFFIMPKWYQKTVYRLGFAIAVCMLLLVFITILYRIRLQNETKKYTYLNYGLKSIRAQLNPHFVFNALGSIQGLMNKNDIEGANHYLTEFSTLLRESLKNNDREFVPLETELRILETYLKLEQLRFHFQYRIHISEVIDKNALEIPALLLQPIVENAIKHGIAVKQEKGMVEILFKQDEKTLSISVSDNGTGFYEKQSSDGFGLKLTRDRIELLNKSLPKQSIKLTIESVINSGTTVHLSFENWL